MIFSFNQRNIPALSRVGGKAKALIEMSKAGFPVPEGVALSIVFFDKWLNDIKSSTEFKAVLADASRKTVT